MEGCIIRDEYEVGPRIGSGSFGEIHYGSNVTTGEKLAIKLEHGKSRRVHMMREARAYKLLQGGTGIPNVKWVGTDGENYALVMDLLGDDLEELFDICGKNLSLKSVLMLADQMIDRIEFVHSKSCMHRDIKPANFLMGRNTHEDKKKVFIIDFGLATMYIHPSTHQHIPCRKNNSLIGTSRFASINTHFCVEQSRRDDLESLGYILMYFLRGSLPWQDMHAGNSERNWEKVKEIKMRTSIEALCHGYPKEFASYLHYCRSLQFDEKPDYGYLKRMFSDLFSCEGFQLDHVFDWTILRYQETVLATPPDRVLVHGAETSSQISPAIASDGEERKPFDRSKVHPSSSMTEAHDLDAAGSIQRLNTPVENVYVDGEERKPFDRSKVHPSSSMTEAHDLDAAGSIQRPNTPVENVYVVIKEAKLLSFKPMKQSKGKLRQATVSSSYDAIPKAGTSCFCCWQTRTTESNPRGVQKTDSEQRNSSSRSSKLNVITSSINPSNIQDHNYILMGFKFLWLHTGVKFMHCLSKKLCGKPCSHLK